VAHEKQPARRRHIPQRSCIACRRTDSKRALIRVVRTPHQGVQIDATGKLAGRGAYLCQARSCWQKAFKSSALNRALKTAVTVDELAALRAFADSLPEALESEDSDALPG
jgi:predicted RNA-binding protein YlxR (DUF448 family)